MDALSARDKTEPISAKRVSQRAPQSCVFCAKRKLRCSKTIPCSNCVERGIDARCHREAVVLSRGVEKGTYRAPRPSMKSGQGRTGQRHRSRGSLQEPSASASPAATIQNSMSTPPQRLDDTTPEAAPAAVEFLNSNNILAPGAGPESVLQINQHYKPDQTEQIDLAVEAAMSLESLAWSAHRHGIMVHGQDRPQDRASPAVLALHDEVRTALTPHQTRSILQYHKEHVAWMHNVIYMPSFLDDCAPLIQSHTSAQLTAPHNDASWISLYCAVLTTGVYYMSERDHARISLDDGFNTARRLYEATIASLTQSDFMVCQSMYSLQAICVAVLCAHAFGDTRRIKVLLSCANTIGQSVGHRLNQLGPLPPPCSNNSSHIPNVKELFAHEVRKRIWCFLCIQDWYLIASKKAYSIVPRHNATPVPFNCQEDHSEMTVLCDLPLTVQTQSTYMIFLYKLTSIYRSLFDNLSNVNAQTRGDGDQVAESFKEVLAADMKLEATMGEIESFSFSKVGTSRASTPLSSSMSSSSLPSTTAATSQWRALVITSWHQRVMIHRSFFCRSFRDKRYHYSRFVCLAAARKIIRSYMEPLPSSSSAAASEAASEIWSIPAHAISGCIIIALNALFTSERYTLERSDMDLMHKCLALLRDSPRPNSIVARGVRVIHHLLNQAPLNRFRKLDPHEIALIARDIDSDTSPPLAPSLPLESPSAHIVRNNPQSSAVSYTSDITDVTAAAASAAILNSIGIPDHGNETGTMGQFWGDSRLDSNGGGSLSDDELFMPWLFDSVMGGCSM